MVKIDSSNYKILIGTWKTRGSIKSSNETLVLDGFDSYELILDGNYILHKADVKMGKERSETFEIISLEGLAGKARMQYFNSKGETGVMTCFLHNNEFKINGNGIKFRGSINNEGTEISGNWFLQNDTKEWDDFIQLNIQKQK